MGEQNFLSKVVSGKKLDISKVKYFRGDIGIVMQTIPIDKADEDGKVTIEITPSETTAFVMDMKLQNTSTFIRETIHSRRWTFGDLFA